MEYNHHDVLGNGTVQMKSHFVAKFWIRYLLHGVWAYWREEEGDGLLAFALRAVSDFMLLFASRALPDCLLASLQKSWARFPGMFSDSKLWPQQRQ